MDELKELLEHVSDTYEDFVGGVVCAIKHGGCMQEVKEYIVRNPEATSSDILEYLDELGI